MKNLSGPNDPEFTRLQMKASTVTVAAIILLLELCLFAFLYLWTK